MFSKWSWSIQAICTLLSIYSFGEGLVQMCGHIIPESPVVPLGSNFTAYCILYEKCLSQGNAEQIVWRTKNVAVPKEQYHIINETVSSVTFNDTSALTSVLTCNILMKGQLEQTIYGINIQFGLPPEKPENLSCIFYQRINLKNLFVLTCTWEPGRNTLLNTIYSLKARWAAQIFPDCIPEDTNNSCTIYNDVDLYVNTKVRVEAKNVLGKADSEEIEIDPAEYAKLLPPHKVSVLSQFPTILTVSWVNPLDPYPLDLEYNIQYRAIGSMDWIEVPLEETASLRTSFNVQDLKPHTQYVFRLRCKFKGKPRFWSDWSKEAVGFTVEDKPSKGPAIWRKITPHSSGNWTLLLNWKELNNSEANGKLLWYEVTVAAKPPLLFPSKVYNLTTTELTLNVPNGTYVVRIIAHNSIGASPASVLLIPATNSKPAVKDVKAYPVNKQLWVEWTAPQGSISKYTIEWCEQCDRLNCPCEWQQEPGMSKGTFLTGDIKSLKCYLITVYPCYLDGQGDGRSTQAYLVQGTPATGPTVRTKKVGKSEVVLEWKPLSMEEQNGFIKRYTISYRTHTGNKTDIDVKPSTTEYTLSSLLSDTLYMVEMAAYTDRGGSVGPTFTFTTQRFGEGEIEAIVVPVCLAFLLITLLGVLFCFNKRDIIKKHIWPNVPDPSKSVIAQWSPQTPSKHFNSQEQIYPEGSFTDVSVVEIEADDKKSFSDQDLKPFDVVRKEKNASEGHSSGIGGSSCMSSPRQSVSDSDEGEPAQNTSSTVQYSTVVPSGYRDQRPSVQGTFSRSESTQPLLDSEERPEEQQLVGNDSSAPMHHYFKQNESIVDESNLERIKPISPIMEEDSAGHKALQTCGFDPGKDEQDLTRAFHPSHAVQTAQFEKLGINTVMDAEVPKSYMPQTVRQGGYMPQ